MASENKQPAKTLNDRSENDIDPYEIQIENLSKIYNSDSGDGVHALENINITIKSGEFVSVVGPSGCGKSTLLDVIAGLVSKSSGTVTVDGEPVTGPRSEIGVAFQDASLFPWRTIMRNVEFGLEVIGVDKEPRRARAQEMIDLVGLSGFEDAYPDELSGGMQQRVSLARTLSADPNILLMDEPFGALDEQTRTFMGEELLRIWSGTNKTVVFITHSLQEAVLLSDRVAVMSNRPGTLLEIFDVGLERPRSTDIIGDKSFSEIQTGIWEIVKEESDRTLREESQ